MRDKRDDQTLLVVEEAAEIHKQRTVTGRVRVSTRTELVEEMARATLDQESVEVERVPIGREVDVAPAIRTEGEVTIIPVLEEVLVVEKRLLLKEELHIRRRVTSEASEIPIKLRKQTAQIERIEGDEPGSPANEETTR